MPINCITQFNIDNNVTVLEPNTTYIGNIIDSFDGAYYRYELLEQETMTFTININPATLNSINVILKLYKKVNNVYTEVGTSFLTEFYNTLTYNGDVEDYYFCLTTDFEISYTLDVAFTDYPYTLLPEFDFYSGSFTPAVELVIPRLPCDLPIFYNLVQGELPVGLSFHSAGRIDGVISNQDCHSPNVVLPSNTWHKVVEDETVPTTLNYRVTIRAALLNDPNTYKDRDFDICVHNNWSTDRDGFIDSFDALNQDVFIDYDGEQLITIQPAFEDVIETVDGFISNCKMCDEIKIETSKITSIPKTMCNEIIVENSIINKPKYISGVPNNFLSDYVNDLNTKKSCKVIIYDKRADIYPNSIVLPTYPTLPLSLCTKCVN